MPLGQELYLALTVIAFVVFIVSLAAVTVVEARHEEKR